MLLHEATNRLSVGSSRALCRTASVGADENRLISAQHEDCSVDDRTI